jgi:hypothetical protein
MSADADRNTGPTVSVILRSMDRPQLGRALASIQAQDVEVIAEVVVVAACGPAHRPVPTQLGRMSIRFVQSHTSLDRPRAANAGLDVAAGRFITFLDDDGELLPSHFRLLLGEFAKNPTTDFVHALSLAVDRQGRTLHVYGGPWIEWHQLTHGFFQLGAVMFKRELLDRGVRFDTRLRSSRTLNFSLNVAKLPDLAIFPSPSCAFI